MEDEPVFIVYPGPIWGWAVACKGGTQSQVFTDKTVAVNYAKSWAEANRPSRVQVENREGVVEDKWDFGPFAGEGV